MRLGLGGVPGRSTPSEGCSRNRLDGPFEGLFQVVEALYVGRHIGCSVTVHEHSRHAETACALQIVDRVIAYVKDIPGRNPEMIERGVKYSWVGLLVPENQRWNDDLKVVRPAEHGKDSRQRVVPIRYDRQGYPRITKSPKGTLRIRIGSKDFGV